MSRRNFLKQLSIIAVASACAYKGGSIVHSKDIEKAKSLKTYSFKPFEGRKHSGFKFSAPLPFDYKLIDELVEINNTYKKSQLTTLYGALPDNVNPIPIFTSGRGTNPKITNFFDFSKYVKYAKEKGFNFVYLINSPKPFFMNEFLYFKPFLDGLLVQLKDIGVIDIKLGNPQMFEIFKEIQGFNIHASTALEYTNIRQYQNMTDVYPFIKSFNPAIDTNRNIPLLKNLKKIYKDIEFELMVDEGCIYGCPARIAHISGPDFIFPCHVQFYKKAENKWKDICRKNMIYPWNLDYYANMGYKHFKLMGCPYGMRPNTFSVAFVRDYFEAVENGVKDFTLGRLFKIMGNVDSNDKKYDVNLTQELLAQFPDINFFIENGGKCSLNCGAECNYCLECAEKLYKIFPI